MDRHALDSPVALRMKSKTFSISKRNTNFKIMPGSYKYFSATLFFVSNGNQIHHILTKGLFDSFFTISHWRKAGQYIRWQRFDRRSSGISFLHEYILRLFYVNYTCCYLNQSCIPVSLSARFLIGTKLAEALPALS